MSRSPPRLQGIQWGALSISIKAKAAAGPHHLLVHSSAKDDLSVQSCSRALSFSHGVTRMGQCLEIARPLSLQGSSHLLALLHNATSMGGDEAEMVVWRKHGIWDSLDQVGHWVRHPSCFYCDRARLLDEINVRVMASVFWWLPENEQAWLFRDTAKRFRKAPSQRLEWHWVS